jgi:predicted XRE-type DNA-binding protein
MEKKIQFTKSSGNVFEDLGLPNSGERLIKAKLATLIEDLIEARNLTQVQSAKILGIPQPKISALLNGKLSGFSVERLFNFLNLLDQDIEILVHQKPHISYPATLSVLSVK